MVRAMSNFPIDYEADYVEERSRLTTFFRLFMVIPQYLFGIILGIAGFFTVVAAWFALVFTGKYPEGLYKFNSGILRWSIRVTGYYLLATDAYPPFNIDEDDSYPIRVKIAPAKAQYNRLHAFFRGITMIPAYLVASVLLLVSEIGAIGAWFMVVFTGKTSPGLQGLINMGIAYAAKFHGYYMLLHEEWFPPISDDASSAGALPTGGDAAKAPAVGSKSKAN
jgi:uncharacterized membrane protein